MKARILTGREPVRFSGIVACCLLALASPFFLQTHADGGQEESESARGFVQTFYQWYVPQALTESNVPASDRALREKGAVFSPTLFRALKADFEAQAKVKGEIVGLDFDPFLNSQDPCERYDVGTVTHNRNDYWVEIYGICSGKKHEKPDVAAEVTLQNNRWLFVNFHYPGDRDLLAALKALRESRK